MKGIQGKTRTVISVILLAAAAGFILYGWQRGEADVVLGKAVTICLQCIGIG